MLNNTCENNNTAYDLVSSVVPIIDFSILSDASDLKHLYIMDKSSWKHLDGTVASYIDITLAGASKPNTFLFTKGRIFEYNSNTLNLTDNRSDNCLADIPDGIIKVKVYVCDGCDFSKTIYYLNTKNLKKKFNKYVCSIIENGCANDINDYTHRKIMKIRNFIYLAEIAASYGDINKAMSFYEIAKNEI